MENNLPKSVLIVKEWFKTNNFDKEIVILNESARSAQEAADSLNCKVEQIAKSLVFKTKLSNNPVLVIASGKNRVNEKLISDYVGEKIIRADAVFVKETTGFSIGGIPPVAHQTKMQIYLDKDLLDYKEIWAAAGHPFAVFQTNADELKHMTFGTVVSIA